MANRRATNIGAARVEVGSWLVALSSDEGLRRAVQVANTAHLSWMTGDLWYHARILLFLDKFTLPLEQMDLASPAKNSLRPISLASVTRCQAGLRLPICHPRITDGLAAN